MWLNVEEAKVIVNRLVEFFLEDWELQLAGALRRPTLSCRTSPGDMETSTSLRLPAHDVARTKVGFLKQIAIGAKAWPRLRRPVPFAG